MSGSGATGSSFSAGTVEDTGTTAEAKPTAAADSSAGQNDVREPEEAAANEDIKGQNLDQPGPKSLETVAKEKGGDAGNVQSEAGKTETSGASDDKDKKDNKESNSEGTGEQWVKTTGFQADGGDFDASKPGAGREADREFSCFHLVSSSLFERGTQKCEDNLIANERIGLMEEKGIHKDPGSKPTPDTSADKHKDSSHKDTSHTSKPHSGDADDKPSIGDRIKAKLHKS